MRVSDFELRLHSLVAFGSRCGRGEIVRLKPDLLGVFASAHGREGGACGM